MNYHVMRTKFSKNQQYLQIMEGYSPNIRETSRYGLKGDTYNEASEPDVVVAN